jgi:hypothetical protein
MEPQPKKGTYFPIGPSAISKLLSQLKSQGHQLSHPQYLNPSKADSKSDYGQCLAELFSSGELCLFSVPESITPSVAVHAVSLGTPQLFSALSHCPPDKRLEKHSLMLRMAEDGTTRVLLRTRHFQVARSLANNQKFSNQQLRVVNITEKEIRGDVE